MTDDNGRTAPKLPPRRPQQSYAEIQARAIDALRELGISDSDAVDIVVLGATGKPPVRYVSAEALTHDDFGIEFTCQPGELVYNARTAKGPWATMTHESWLEHRDTERLGTGFGQQYTRQANGQLIKTAG